MAVAVEARAQQAEHVRGVRGRRLYRDLVRVRVRVRFRVTVGLGLGLGLGLELG